MLSTTSPLVAFCGLRESGTKTTVRFLRRGVYLFAPSWVDNAPAFLCSLSYQNKACVRTCVGFCRLPCPPGHSGACSPPSTCASPPPSTRCFRSEMISHLAFLSLFCSVRLRCPHIVPLHMTTPCVCLDLPDSLPGLHLATALSRGPFCWVHHD